MLVCDGKVNDNALRAFEKDEKWLEKQLKAKGADKLEEVLFASVDESGQFYMQKRGEK